MSIRETLDYIHSVRWQGSRPGLYRIRTLLRTLGDPQKSLRFVHVAGTNGKGSTCACMASVLQAAGYRVGLNTSPYLVRFHERIRVNGQEITDEELEVLVDRVRPAASAMAEPPTEFELITALAMLHFQARRCDIVVLEVGLGGALDASNVIDPPEAAVITAIGLDHTAQLGPTLADIAAAKAGIIKPGCPVVSYGGCPEADAVIRRVCREQGAQLEEADFSRLRVTGRDLAGTAFDFAPYRALRLPLAGDYQCRNAAVAITALETMRRKGWRISEEALRQGLGQVQWPGRFQVLDAAPLFLLDGAHNPQGLAATVESLGRLLPGKKFVFLTGVMADKDTAVLPILLGPMAKAFFTVRPDNPRAMAAEELAALLSSTGAPATACSSVKAGISAARALAGRDGAVCALGSLYLAGEVLRSFSK